MDAPVTAPFSLKGTLKKDGKVELLLRLSPRRLGYNTVSGGEGPGHIYFQSAECCPTLGTLILHIIYLSLGNFSQSSLGKIDSILLSFLLEFGSNDSLVQWQRA